MAMKDEMDTYGAGPEEESLPMLDNSSQDDDSNSSDLLYDPQRPRRRSFQSSAIRAILVLLALGAACSASFYLGRLFADRNLARRSIEHTSIYSPVLKEMDPKWKYVKFNGTLGHQTEYTGDPSPEVDAVWEKWAHVKYASIPEENFKKLHQPDMESARLTPEYGGGYIGFLEVSHHLHCLNLLRMGVHQDYYMQEEHKPEIFRDRPWTIHLHFQHCIEMLRQNIMCNADVGIIPHHWIKQSPDPFANFNTWHKCRDIGTVERWIEEHAIPQVPEGKFLPRPESDKVWPQPP
ncbi:hypothetical protein MMC17_004281 [Xylographa soralifera]|nr:hypothetical protein [Xylographa soralifera]